MISKIISGVSAGILISLGGSVYLGSDNKYFGAVFFTAALLCICIKGYSLYTGKIGYIPEKCGKEEITVLLTGLFGNIIGTLACGTAMRLGIPKLASAAEVLCASKLEQTIPGTLVRGIFCGVLVYLAVSIYRDAKNIWGIVFCIPLFIIAGFEHSIADMYYFAAAGIYTFDSLVFILIVILGNSIGGMLLPALKALSDFSEKKKGK